MKWYAVSSFFALLVAIISISGFRLPERPAKGSHIIAVKTPAETKDFFTWTKDRIPFISSHRGGPKKGLPENCFATFENTLQHTWSLIELDPHFTKDSTIVLMHDATLERTSNGTGKVSDHTLAEIRQLKLKDTEGNLTGERIPTLDEAIEWAKGRTIIMIDEKDVSTDVRVRKIREHKAQANALVMAYKLEDAKRCYQLDPTIMMEAAFIHDLNDAEAFDKSGVPWKNVVVFVTHTEPKDKAIFDYVHRKGAMCIRGSSRTIDKEFTDGKLSAETLSQRYRQLIRDGSDIIEADLGIEAGEGISSIQKIKSSKQKYFSVVK